MDGEMLLYGYKFVRKVQFHFRSRTIFVPHEEYGLVHDIFDFMQKFFNRRDFSTSFVNKGVGLCLNGEQLFGGEYEVFYVPPLVDSGEVLKVLRKTLLGRLWQQLFATKHNELLAVQMTMQQNIANTLNEFLRDYNLHYNCETADILGFSKLLTPEAWLGSDEIQLEELGQYDLKRLMIAAIGQLQTSLPRILLLELPEYGMRSQEVVTFWEELASSPIEYMLIQTQDKGVADIYGNIFNYHYVTPQGLCSFEDWDEIFAGKIIAPEMTSQLESYIVEQLFDGVKDQALRQFVQENIKHSQ